MSWLWLVALVALLAGCETPTQDRVAFPQSPPSDDRMEALLEGTLALEGRCLVARTGGNPVMLLWPAHVRLDTSGAVVRVWDTETGVWAAVGERVWLGGGSTSAAAEVDGCPAPQWAVGNLARAGYSPTPTALPRLAPLPERATELDLNLLEGTLVRDGRCLRVSGALVVWPPGTALDGDTVRDLEGGAVRVGGPAALDGWNRGTHTLGQVQALGLAEPVPAECGGPYWVTTGADDAPPPVPPVPPPPPPPAG